MDAELAKELQQATDELLDLGPLRPSSRNIPSSPHLHRPRAATAPAPAKQFAPTKLPTFLSSSKLEIIHSPTDVRPFHWPVPPTTNADRDVGDIPSLAAAKGGDGQEPIKIELGSSTLDDGDDHLPARGLSSRMSSVKAATGESLDEEYHRPVDLIGDIQDEHRVASPSRLRVRTPINDIYINQYGERIVQGKVVGRILGGRPRPASRNEHAPHPSSSSIALERTSFSSLSRSSPPLQSPAAHASSPSPTKDATSPPAFFLESFPDAFGPTSRTTTPVKPKKESRPSKGGPPSILKAPCSVAGALTLAHSDNIDQPVLVRDVSFRTASDFGSPSSSSSKQLSPRPQNDRLSSVSSSKTDDVDGEIDSGLRGLLLHNVDAGKEAEDGYKGLLSPTTEGTATTDTGHTTRSILDLPTLRRPTPTIELSQAKVETVLHGNRRQARASGVVVQPGSEASSSYASPAVSPPANVLKLPSMHDDTTSGDDNATSWDQAMARFGSASEPSSPLLSPRHTRFSHNDDGSNALETGDVAGDEEDDTDKASLESAPSSLISLPVSTLTSSSRTPSHTSLERRRSASSSHTPCHRRRTSLNNPHYSHSTDVFAREVKIRGWSEVGSQARGWVVYELRILTKQGTPIIAHKRFSSFVKLRETLKKERKEQSKWLPELPSKSAGLLSKYDAKYLEKRRRALQRWLEVVVLDRVWGGSEGLREWVLASD